MSLIIKQSQLTALCNILDKYEWLTHIKFNINPKKNAILVIKEINTITTDYLHIAVQEGSHFDFEQYDLFKTFFIENNTTNKELNSLITTLAINQESVKYIFNHSIYCTFKRMPNNKFDIPIEGEYRASCKFI